MPFIKGNKKVGGRQKGGVNKVTATRREFIKNLLDSEQDNIIDALQKTRTRFPNLYLNIISDFMEFDTPKLSRVEMKHEGEITTTAIITGTPPPDEI